MAKGDEKKQPGAEPVQPPAADQQAQTAEAGAEPVQPPAADQQAQTAEADAVTIRSLHEMIMLVGDQLEALTDRLAELEQRVAAIGEPVAAVLDSTEPPQIDFDPAWLEGLTFKDVKEVKPEAGENGRKVKRYSPFERDALESDVMGWRKDGGEIVITLGDGSRHRVIVP